jgi:sn-glycerol 3-phosphate transport system substrate-binding protein
MRARGRGRAALIALALIAAACGGDGGGGGGGGGGGNGDAAACDPSLLDDVTEPVEIVLWHTLQAENVEVLAALVKEFNASQEQVRVRTVQQPSYPELFTKYKAGLSSGDLPALAQMEETVVQAMLDSNSTVPISACIEAADYDTSDFVPRTLDYYTVGDELRSMPWTISNPILLFDRSAFRDAGLDPDDPPRTLDELREAAQTIVDEGTRPYGMSLQITPYIMEFLYAKSGQPYVNNGGGRDGRATESLLAEGDGPKIWQWWHDMVTDGLALNTGAQAGGTDHLFAIGNKKAAMTLESTPALGPISAVLESGQFPGLEIGVGALPAMDADGGVPVGDGSLWIPEAASAVERAAAWRFIEFLVDTPQQAKLHASSRGGYIPIRQSATEDPTVAALWAKEPELRIAFDQLLAGEDDPAASGSVIGDYQGVRDAVRDALVAMLAGDLTPQEAAEQADAEATEAIQAYNTRVGG